MVLSGEAGVGSAHSQFQVGKSFPGLSVGFSFIGKMYLEKKIIGKMLFNKT